MSAGRTRTPPARTHSTARRGKGARPKTTPRRTVRAGPPLSRRLLAAQPLSPASVRRIAIGLFTALLVLIGWQVGRATGVNAYLAQETVDAVGRAGFAVKRIEVVGAQRIDRMHIYDIALRQQDRSMAAFDLAEVRRELLRYGWVADARVSRRLPDTLVIDLVERTPVAVWQHQGRYALIDRSGIVLPGVDPATLRDLPVLVGQGANRQMPALERLIAVAPALRPQLAGASWIGNRRWDLRFRTGEVLVLPEDTRQASEAFADFARIDGMNRLLGRGIRRIDMRIRDRLVLRPGREGDLGDIDTLETGDRSAIRDAAAIQTPAPAAPAPAAPGPAAPGPAASGPAAPATPGAAGQSGGA